MEVFTFIEFDVGIRFPEVEGDVGDPDATLRLPLTKAKASSELLNFWNLAPAKLCRKVSEER